jgi:cell division transport system permease protein
LGFLGYLGVQARWWIQYLHENVEIQVFLPQETDSLQVRSLLQKIQKFPEVKEVTFVSREQAARDLSQDLGEDFVDFLGENPLLSSIKVHLHYRFGEKPAFEALKGRLRNLEGVGDVVYPVHLLASLQRNFGTLVGVLLALSMVLFGVTWLLIDQSVRLVLFADRHLIRSMQLVGADDGFIRKPYLKRAMRWSLIAWFSACLLLIVTVFWVLEWAPELHYQGSEPEVLGLALVLLMFSVLTGWLSHYVALTKYLRLESDHLH